MNKDLYLYYLNNFININLKKNINNILNSDTHLIFENSFNQELKKEIYTQKNLFLDNFLLINTIYLLI